MWAGIVGLIVLNTLVFGAVVTFEFLRWDDNILITESPLLREPWSGSLIARFFDPDHALRFKPLHWAMARAIRSVADFDPAVWHAANLILHVAATALFYVVLRQLAARLRGSDTVRGFSAEIGPLFGAALWAVHPLRAEPVSWLSVSTYPLAAVFLLGSFSCYLRANGTGVSGFRWLVGSWVLATMAYASYPVTVTYGLFLFAADKWLLAGTGPAGVPAATGRLTLRTAVKYALFLGPAAVAVAITTWSRIANPGIFAAAPSIESVAPAIRVLMAFASLTFIAGRLVWPVNLTPNVPPLAGEIVTPALVILAVVAGVALFGAWSVRRKHPLIAFGVIGFALLSLPCLGLTEYPTWPVDRYCYVAHLPLAGALALSPVGRWTAATQRTAIGLAVVVIAGLGVAARAQCEIWRNTETLFTSMSTHPNFKDSPRQEAHIYVMWAGYEAARGRAGPAADRLNQAQAVYVAAMQRAIGAGNYREALSLLTHVERHLGLTPVLRREKGAWLLRENRPEEALRELQVLATALSDDERLRTLTAEAKALTRGAAPASAPAAARP